MILQDAQHAELGERSGKAAAKSQADARSKGRAIRKERSRMERTRHELRMTVESEKEHGPHVLNARY